MDKVISHLSGGSTILVVFLWIFYIILISIAAIIGLLINIAIISGIVYLIIWIVKRATPNKKKSS